MRHQPRKRFGQNFLRDDGVIHDIERAIAPAADDHLVEIGPGEGALTQALVTSGCKLDAVELDRNLTTRLLAAFSIYPGFTLHSADALAFDFEGLASPAQRLRVVGNLPYNISTPLIIRLLEQKTAIEDMHFMLQLEVVERLAAEPGSKEWGRLGVLTQLQCEVEKLIEVPPEAFYPPPKVQSAVVRLTPRQTSPYPPVHLPDLQRLVTQAFSQRRKTLRNTLKKTVSDDVWQKCDIDPNLRPEMISIEQFVALSNLLQHSR